MRRVDELFPAMASALALAVAAMASSACVLDDGAGECTGSTCREADGGFPTPDATCPDPDGSAVPPDAGPGAPDAGPGAPDAMVSPDAMISPDAMVSPDAGTPPDAPGPDDCDPDPPIFPGAEEVVDGIDNDCDGLIDELEVCASGATYGTIASAIAAAPAGSTIEICPGTYYERLTINGKALRLVGGGAQATSTIIDAEQLGTTLVVAATPGQGVVVERLVLRNGKTSGNGGGVRCGGSRLRLDDVRVETSNATEGGGVYAGNCTIDILRSTLTGNQASQRGGAISIRGGAGALEDSTVSSNGATRHGGGVASSNADFSICRNNISLNTAGLQGGGLHYRGNGTIENNRVTGNSSGWTGGGIYIDQLAPTLSGNEIVSNMSDNDGAGVYLHQSSALVENNYVASNHSGDDGGGIRLFECDSVVRGNTIASNIADDSGGGIRVSHVPCQFIDNIIVDNSAQGAGGGIDMDNDSSQVRGGEVSRNKAGAGGGIHAWLFPWSGGAIEDVLFEGNEGWHGGALHVRHNFQRIKLRGLTFKDNVAGYGAGMFLRTTQFTLSHSVFVDNWASHDGAAMLIGRDGSAYHEEECPPCPPSHATGTIEFVVAYDNEADEAGSALWMKSPNLIVRSSILSDNPGQAVYVNLEDTAPTTPPAPGQPPHPAPPNPPTWRYNNTYPASFAGISDPTGTGGNLSDDPLFADPGLGNFQLTSGSVCIDAGDPAFIDLDNTRADMGAFGGLGGNAP